MTIKINPQNVVLFLLFCVMCLAAYWQAFVIQDSQKGTAIDAITFLCMYYLVIGFAIALVVFVFRALIGDYDHLLQKEINIPMPGKKSKEKDNLLSLYGEACVRNDKAEQDRLYNILKAKNHI